MNTLSVPARKRSAALMILPALGLLAAACSSTGSSSNTASSSYGGSTVAKSTGGGKAVTVTETDYKIALSQSKFTPGKYTFKIADKGQVTHALEIDGPGVSDRKSAPVTPGKTTSLTVTLQKGKYEVYCPVDGHKGLGMDTTITVG